MTVDETHRMTLSDVAALAKAAGFKIQADDRTSATVESTVKGYMAECGGNCDPVALALERRKRDR